MDNIKSQLETIQTRIEAAKKQALRTDNVDLLAVSKYHPIEKIKALYELGQHDFGENYVSEAEEKINALSDYDINWHFIGPIQSNKTRTIASLFNWVQSVDRIKIARRLNEQRPKQLEPLNICLQINISREGQKSGFLPEQIEHEFAQILSFSQIRVRGLMAIPENTDDPQKQADNFAQLRDLREKLEVRFSHPMDTLSMGMSNDLEAAIAQGSSMVRIGTALFGARG